jgi:hypothetical protein
MFEISRCNDDFIISGPVNISLQINFIFSSGKSVCKISPGWGSLLTVNIEVTVHTSDDFISEIWELFSKVISVHNNV